MVTVVEALKDRFGIAAILQIIGIADSTSYGWLTQERAPSARRRSDVEFRVVLFDQRNCDRGSTRRVTTGGLR